jgi:hypothetical protein
LPVPDLDLKHPDIRIFWIMAYDPCPAAIFPPNPYRSSFSCYKFLSLSSISEVSKSAASASVLAIIKSEHPKHLLPNALKSVYSQLPA